ncbi:hypothetical protein, partial [Escherichia coli]|uniref:hypothetical protein n=1 Tax=Escherichia coli TaxID=562 RepID=UPI00195399C7
LAESAPGEHIGVGKGAEVDPGEGCHLGDRYLERAEGAEARDGEGTLPRVHELGLVEDECGGRESVLGA